ncbi:MAG: putative toxin-antitoxin system toxin component, PIN family [Tenuifilaceae bacterium]
MKRKNKKYKIIIDTNIWISFLIGKSLRGLQNHIDSQSIKIITCKEQYYELSEVFKKPKIKKYFSKEQVEGFFELLDESSDCIELVTKTNICRDKKDNYLVSLAIDS